MAHLPAVTITAQQLGASTVGLARRLAADVFYTAIKMAVVVAVCSYFVRPAQGAFVGALSKSRSSMCSKVLNLADSGAGVHAICDARFDPRGTAGRVVRILPSRHSGASTDPGLTRSGGRNPRSGNAREDFYAEFHPKFDEIVLESNSQVKIQ